jgi:hypothetical protein
MTEQAATTGKAAQVMVECKGILNHTPFTLMPMGLEPKVYTFIPGVGVLMPRPYADYLDAMDPTKFVVVEGPRLSEQQAPAQQQEQAAPAEDAKASKAEKRKIFLDRMARGRAAKKTK